MESNQNNSNLILGKSLQLLNGDLHLADGDFTMVSGLDNFIQAMPVMIETPFSKDIFNVNYGFDLMNSISKPQGIRMTKELIRLNIVKSLSLDNRVREIKEIVFDDDPRYFELNHQENAEESRRNHKRTRSWQAMVVLQTVSDNEVVFRLEGVLL
ncbi:MAG: hypothetical protein GY774_20845 [Planctomycetes bacterium]|nr:hypothetical protein [Planctomycetota bacterium]